MGVSKHYAAWSAALSRALLGVYARRALESMVADLFIPLRVFYDDLATDSDTTVYYGDEPCNCAMCRPIGGRPRQYDC